MDDHKIGSDCALVHLTQSYGHFQHCDMLTLLGLVKHMGPHDISEQLCMLFLTAS